jgi:hypothetical protein
VVNAFAVLLAWFLDWRLARRLGPWRGEDDGAETLVGYLAPDDSHEGEWVAWEGRA